MSKSIKSDTQLNTPIFQQIVEAGESQILSESLKEGDFLLSVRELAVQIETNPNTIVKAYKVLQNRELVESVRGKGLQVRPINKVKSDKRKQQIIMEKVQELIAVAKGLEIPKKELNSLIKEEMKNE